MRSNIVRFSRVTVRWDEFDRLAKERGWDNDSEIARNLGLAPSTISNLRSGRYAPGAFVINQMLTGFETTYESLFELEQIDQAVA